MEELGVFLACLRDLSTALDCFTASSTASRYSGSSDMFDLDGRGERCVTPPRTVFERILLELADLWSGSVFRDELEILVIPNSLDLEEEPGRCESLDEELWPNPVDLPEEPGR